MLNLEALFIYFSAQGTQFPGAVNIEKYLFIYLQNFGDDFSNNDKW